jgi:pyocin large subunit-like protein
MLKRTNKINTLIVSLIIVMAVFFTGCSMTYDNSQTSGTTVAAEATTETTTSSSATASDNTKSTSRTNSKQTSADSKNTSASNLTFRNENLLNSHYEKHGKDMGFSSAKEYEKAAAAVVANSSALHKKEAEDGDDVYYIESTNEFVIVSTDGYIRTYFNPDAGIAYYNRQ